jgi:hypothetical protein
MEKPDSGIELARLVVIKRRETPTKSHLHSFPSMEKSDSGIEPGGLVSTEDRKSSLACMAPSVMLSLRQGEPVALLSCTQDVAPKNPGSSMLLVLGP